MLRQTTLRLPLLSLILLIAHIASALKFDLIAQSGHSAKNERCIRNFVNRDTLVVVTATVSGSRGDGQMVNMHVSHSTSGPLSELDWEFVC
jgi:p24 family protein delta-1